MLPINLAQAEVSRYTDWHPPFMAMLWSLWPVPAFMLLIQNVLHWTGIALLASRLTGRWPYLMLAVGLTPIAFKYLGVIQKDTLLASLFVLAFGMAGRARLVPALLGALTRANGPFALIGIVRLPFALLLIAAMVPASMLFNRAVAERSYVERSLPFYDMAGIAHFEEDTSRFPAGCYTPLFWDTLGTQRCYFAFDKAPKSLTGEWVRTIAAHPVSYVRHRLAHFNATTFFLVPARQ